MLPIPSSLLDKVKQAMQTIGNNAEPKMTIIAQKASKYLSQGSFLSPRTVRTGNSLGSLDICIRRETPHQEPTEIVMVYIENGLAKVATLPYVHTPDQYFEYQYTIGPATDVACDFDGRWNLITDRSELYFDTNTIWELITFGEPYIAYINSGVLYVQQGQGASIELSTEAVKCSLLRAWKSVTDILTDQGIVCAYIKTDTKIYYRNYCEQPDGSYFWETPREITDFGVGNNNISLFLAADYRLGLLVENTGSIKWAITNRSLSGMAILPEYLSILPANIDLLVKEIEYHNAQALIEYINLLSPMFTIIDKFTGDVLLRDAENISYTDEELEIENDYGYKVRIRWHERVYGTDNSYTGFSLVDSESTSFLAVAIAYTENPKVVEVTFLNFNNAVGDVSVVYDGTGGLTGDLGQAVPASSASFTPTGLVPYIPEPPVMISIINIQAWEKPI